MLTGVLALPPAHAEEPSEEVVVEAPGSAAPTATTLGRAAVVAMPAASADALLRALPGLHQSAHGGHGKAFQYFVRGFDAVHGADLAVDVEGIPLNEPSNIHGHGYLDAHLLPRMLVQGLHLEKGSARASVGDFGVAASASYRLGLETPGWVAQVGAGTDRSARALVGWRPQGAPTGTFLLGEVQGGLGVGARRDHRQVRLAAGVEEWVGSARYRVFALGYDGAFGSPGVLREDDVASGAVPFWGAYPVVGGGRSSRGLVGADLAVAGERAGGKVLAWGGLRALRLEQDYTGFYVDPDHGDGVRQTHRAISAGVRAQGYWRPDGERAPTLTAGLDGRVDVARLGEDGITATGVAWDKRLDAHARPYDLGAWVEASWRPAEWLDLLPSARVAWVGTALRAADDAGWVHGGAPVLAPRLVVTVAPEAVVTGILAAGRGYRSAEALGVGDGGRVPATLADTAEAAVHLDPHPALSLRLGSFGTWLSNEIVFEPTAGRFQATGPTRRVGVEAVAVIRPIAGLRIQSDLTWTDGRYLTSGDPIPYAPRWLVALGATTDALPWGETRWTAGVRGFFLGARPLPGGFRSTPNVVVDATARVGWRKLFVDLEIDNLLARRWRDGEFVYPSHFDPTAPRSERPARHFTAGAPFAARAAVGWRLP